MQNLETIQGDERDVVIISTVYGPERGSTTMYQRFGPINSEQGYKRLNVIITRQRIKLVVFTSILSSYIQNPSSKGLVAFKDWLSYLENDLIPVRPYEINYEIIFFIKCITFYLCICSNRAIFIDFTFYFIMVKLIFKVSK